MIKSVFYKFLFIYFLVFSLSTSVYAADEIIRVGFFDYEGFNEKTSDGIYSGYGYDYLQEMAKYTGWKYEFVQCSWSACLSKLAAGELDILGLALKTKEREELYDFTSIDMGVSYVILTVKDNNTTMVFNESENVNGLTVGLFKGNVQNVLLREYCKKNNIKIIEKIYDTQKDINDAFTNGEIDAIVSSNLRKIDNERIIGTFSPGPIYFITTKGNFDIVTKVDYALSNIKSNNPNFDNELFAKHYPRKKNSLLLLTREELDFIKSADRINVVYFSKFSPLEYYNDKTRAFDGTVAKVFDIIQKKSGLSFNYIPVQSREEGLQYIVSGKADMIAAIPDYYHSNFDFVLSLPVLKLQMLTVRNKSAENLDDKKIAILKDQVNFFKSRAKSSTFCSSVQECMQFVNDGKADFTYMNTYAADYLMRDPKYRNIAPLSFADISYQLSIGISQRSNIMLLPIINKAINSITDSEYNEIIFDSTSEKEDHKKSLISLLYSNPVEMIMIIFVFFCLILVLFFFRNSMMQERIANKSKSMFLAKMSHEVRTPINAITGFLRLLKSEKLNLTASEYVNIIEKSTITLLELVNSILDISKIESGKIKLDLKSFHILNELSSVATLFVGSMLENRIRLITYFDPQIPTIVLGDNLRLRQILSNLLSNASKFTKSGGVVALNVFVLSKTNQVAEIRFSVKDTGIGIPKSEISNIINPFHQLEDSIISQQRGTGLGLTISNEFAKLMGGQIDVESEVGVGSEFSFTIKVEIIEDCKPLKQIEANIGYIEVSDEDIAVDPSLSHLKPSLKVFTSLDKLLAYNLSKMELIIVSNCKLNDDALVKINEIRKHNNKMPILLLTYPIDSKKFSEFIDANVSVVVRPLSCYNLHAKIIELIYESSNISSKATENLEEKRFVGNVLVAEDELINSKLIKIVLSKYGLGVTLVSNGKEALDIYDNGFDLIFMDINMPIMDGKDATKAIRIAEENNGSHRTPIVALTANVMKGDEVEYFKIGVDDVLSKPYEIAQLEGILKKYLVKDV